MSRVCVSGGGGGAICIARPVLLLPYCPSCIARPVLPALHCPSCIPHPVLPVLYCLSYIPCLVLPVLYCPSCIAHPVLPMPYCPSCIASTSVTCTSTDSNTVFEGSSTMSHTSEVCGARQVPIQSLVEIEQTCDVHAVTPLRIL